MSTPTAAPPRVAPVAAPRPRDGGWAGVRRRAATTGVVAGAVLSTVMTATIAGRSWSLVGAGNPWLVGLGTAVNLVAAVLLVWRHRWPWLVFGVAVVGPLVLITDGFAALCALVVLVRTRPVTPALAGAVGLTYLAAAVSLTWDAGRDDDYSALLVWRPRTAVGDAVVPGWVPWLVAAVLVALAVGLGVLLRTTTALAAAERTTRRVATESGVLREEVVRAEERARLARDIHDGLSNLLTRISLHAGALQVRGYPGLPTAERDDVVGTAELIWETSHQAVEELHAAVGVLGRPGRTAGPSGIDAVPGLVRDARQDGFRVVLTLDVPLVPPAAGPSHAAYRVVREALTNLRRYAPDRRGSVSVWAEEGVGVRVEVRSPLPPRPPTSQGAGSGLGGLAALVAAEGGRLDAGPVGGEFVVTARVPWGPVGGPG